MASARTRVIAATFAALVMATACVPVGPGGGASVSGPRDPLDAFQTSSTQVLPAPGEPPLAQPWQVGQWAAYRVTRPAGVSVLVVRIVAEDTCGTWVDLETDDGEHRRVTRACVVRKLSLTNQWTITSLRALAKRVDDKLTNLEETEQTNLDEGETADIVKMLRETWSGRRGIARKDVTTPAGTFTAALEQPGDKPGHARWSHPAVPITGLVRSVFDGEELALLEYGPQQPTTAVGARQPTLPSAVLADQRNLFANDQTQRRLESNRRKWVAFSFGSEAYGTLDETSFTASLNAMIGYFVRRHLSLVLDSGGTTAIEYPPRPTISERFTNVTLGLRWYPYERPTHLWRGIGFDTKSVYLQTGVGYAEAQRSGTDVDYGTVGRGGVAGLRLGINVGYTRDWRMALELHTHAALLNGDEGLRILAGLRANIELFLP